jgi:hypothetical protein
MADLTIFEKYPNSWRIDHPDFGDVSKTTYAKGVITDFQKVSDDPVEVQSLVKVDIGGDAWLPLFFHPKKLYWDPDSQKFNQDGSYFEKAWMSFRAADEVAVMLKEGKPVAVMGFADGVPRIGEDVLRSENYLADGAAPITAWRTSTGETLADPDVGPDGLKLNLLLPCKKFQRSVETEHRDLGTVGGSLRRYYEINSRETIFKPCTGFVAAYDSLEVWMRPMISGYNIKKKKDIITTHVFYLATIGPFLYYIDTELITDKYSTEHIPIGPQIDDDPLGHPWQFLSWVRHIYTTEFCTPLIPELDFPEVEGYADAWIAGVLATDNTQTFDPPHLPDNDTLIALLIVYKALYTKELYERAKTATTIPSEFKSVISNLNNNIQFNKYIGYGDDPDLKFVVRPHTKAELQAAGLWPAGAS